MFRRLFLSMLMFIFLNVAHTSAESYDNYDWICDYEFPVTPVVRCVNNGAFEHNIYYFSAGNNKCLVVLCHGFVNNDGYGILMHGQYRHDYAQAVAESIAYWTRRGMLKNVGNFDFVFMNTCYSGYAPKTTTLPIYGINLNLAFDHKDVTGFSERRTRNGQVILSLYRAIPKQSKTTRASGSLSKMLEDKKVKGYRSISRRSSSKPEGVTILSNPF